MDTLERDVVALLQDLVAIDSVNPSLSAGGAGEVEIAQHVRGWCTEAGLDADLLDDGDGRPSVIVRPQPGSHAPDTPTLLLCGHLDTVGLGSMREPLHPRRDGDRLYGRGTYDMKAGLAASLIAAREAARQDAGVRVVLAAVADEEHASLGVQRVLAQVDAAAAIVTEPTEMAVGVAHKGFVWTEIEVRGVAAHGSRPELGVDAIVKTAAVLTGLDGLGRSLARRRHPMLGPGTVHAGLITGGEGESTIPERCVLTIERRTLPGEGVADIEREVKELLAACRRADPQFVATARTTLHRPALETPTDHPLVASLTAAHQAIRGRAAEIAGMSYWADSAFIAARGIPTVLFGPGGDGAHAEVEWVSIADTVDCARILIRTAQAMGNAWGG